MSTHDKRRLANAVSWASFIGIVVVMLVRAPNELPLFILLSIPLIGSHLYLQTLRCPRCRELFRSTKRGMNEALRIRPNCPSCDADLRQT